jgi:hypothetical protein
MISAVPVTTATSKIKSGRYLRRCIPKAIKAIIRGMYRDRICAEEGASYLYSEFEVSSLCASLSFFVDEPFSAGY